jgi:hypothetical protein
VLQLHVGVACSNLEEGMIPSAAVASGYEAMSQQRGVNLHARKLVYVESRMACGCLYTLVVALHEVLQVLMESIACQYLRTPRLRLFGSTVS